MSSSKDASFVDEDKRIIKKYPNRRLYDTSTSSYVALNDIKQLIMDGEDFVVFDAKTGSDLTRSILLQILLEEESAGVPLLTEPMLKNMILFYGHSMQSFMGLCLEKNVESLIDFQAKISGASKDFTQLPMMNGLMMHYVDQSSQVLAEIQEKMQQQFNSQAEQMMDAMRLKHR